MFQRKQVIQCNFFYLNYTKKKCFSAVLPIYIFAECNFYYEKYCKFRGTIRFTNADFFFTCQLLKVSLMWSECANLCILTVLYAIYALKNPKFWSKLFKHKFLKSDLALGGLHIMCQNFCQICGTLLFKMMSCN